MTVQPFMLFTVSSVRLRFVQQTSEHLWLFSVMSHLEVSVSISECVRASFFILLSSSKACFSPGLHFPLCAARTMLLLLTKHVCIDFGSRRLVVPVERRRRESSRVHIICEGLQRYSGVAVHLLAVTSSRSDVCLNRPVISSAPAPRRQLVTVSQPRDRKQDASRAKGA